MPLEREYIQEISKIHSVYRNLTGIEIRQFVETIERITKKYTDVIGKVANLEAVSYDNNWAILESIPIFDEASNYLAYLQDKNRFTRKTSC